MTEQPRNTPRIWRPAAGFSVLAMLGVSAICLFARCSGSQAVTPESLAAAREAWQRAGFGDYELEWIASGTTNAHYYVTVRGGIVRKVESVAPDGRRFELHPAEMRFYGVDGLFTTIADELAQLKTDRPFGQPHGMKVAMRFTPDSRLGYPRFYRRDVLGASHGLAIDVIRLIPARTAPGSSDSPS